MYSQKPRLTAIVALNFRSERKQNWNVFNCTGKGMVMIIMIKIIITFSHINYRWTLCHLCWYLFFPHNDTNLYKKQVSEI